TRRASPPRRRATPPHLEEGGRWPATPGRSNCSRRCSTRARRPRRCAATAPSCSRRSGGGGRSSASSTTRSGRCSRASGRSPPPGRAPPAPRPAALPQIPGYELPGEVGRGGMGVVHRARAPSLDRDVAVKVPQDRFPADSPVARRFTDEARITAQLQHPGVPAVYRVGALADGRPFLAMKLIKGRTLAALLGKRPDRAADRGRYVAIFEHVCQAVAYAHSLRVIHRDLKPSNVMVGKF